MKLGYARVSTEDQTLDLQRPRLLAVGCEKLFEEKISGAKRNRPELEKLLGEVRNKDILVVTRLDRLARSTVELLAIAERLREKDTGLQSLDEPWVNTESPSGRMILTVFAGIAEFERALRGVIAESSQNPMLRGVEERRTRIAEGPEAVLEWFCWPNVVAIEGDVFPTERSEVSNKIIGNDLAA